MENALARYGATFTWMMNTRTYLRISAVIMVVVFAGCMGAAPAAEQPDSTTSPYSGQVLAVTEIPKSDVTDASNTSKVEFSALTPAHQEEFRSALDSDVRNPSAWDDGTDIEYVHYNETWYSVQIHIVN